MSLCIASGNPGKLAEINLILKGSEFAQSDFNIVENAIIKANSAARISNKADDSGLCIELLNQEPGEVISLRIQQLRIILIAIIAP